MQVSISTSFLVQIFLVSLRLGAFVLLSPTFVAVRLPVVARSAFVVTLSACLVAMTQPAYSGEINVMWLFRAALHEALIGGALAFGAVCGFAAFSLAGRLIDLQIGYGVANLFDPTTQRQGPLLGTALAMMGLAAFFAVDGHLILIKLLAESISRFPPGGDSFSIDHDVVLRQFGFMFTSGVLLAMPVMVVLLLIDVVMAVMSRSMPQLNAFVISMPIKVVAGLSVLMLVLNHGSRTVMSIFGRIVDSTAAAMGV